MNKMKGKNETTAISYIFFVLFIIHIIMILNLCFVIQKSPIRQNSRRLFCSASVGRAKFLSAHLRSQFATWMYKMSKMSSHLCLTVMWELKSSSAQPLRLDLSMKHETAGFNNLVKHTFTYSSILGFFFNWGRRSRRAFNFCFTGSLNVLQNSCSQHKVLFITL